MPPSPLPPYSAPPRTIWMWGFGAVSDALMCQLFGLIYPIFNTGFGLDAVLLSWAIMLPRLLDAVIDPVVGHFSDNLQTKWGRRKPVLLVSSITGAVLVSAMWWASPEWPKLLQFGYVSIVATLYYCSWGVFSMSHTALGYELTDDYHERSRVIAIRTFFFQVVSLVISWTYWLALRPVFGGEINGIRVISAIFSVIVLAFAVPVLVCTKERFTHPGPHVGMFTAIRESMRLQPFRIYLLLRFFSLFGQVIFNQMVFYINVFYVCSGQKDLAMRIVGISTMLTVILTVALMPLVPKISKRIGKRRGFILASWLALFQAILMPLLFNPRFLYLQLVAAAITGPLVGLGTVLRDAIVPDICDLDERVNGQRREGLITAAISLVYKAMVSLCVLIVGYMVAWSHFNPGISVQPPDVITRLQWFTFLPNVICSGIALYFAIRFSITEEQAAETTRILALRRELQNQIRGVQNVVPAPSYRA